MDSLIILGACAAILLVFFWNRPGILLFIKQPITIIISLAFILGLVFYSGTAVRSALKGIYLWLDIVFPSLFPFFVASEILNSTGFVRASGVLFESAMRPLFNVPGCGSFALAMGVSSGYPVGAKLTAEMRRDGLLKKEEAERLLAFTNNSGPLFIIGAVATGMFGMPDLGLFLWACHILGCLTVGILFRFYRGNGRRIKGKGIHRKETQNSNLPQQGIRGKFKEALLPSEKETRPGIGVVFGDAVRNSVTLILAIGGFIILFSVIINLLLETGIISGLADMLALAAMPLGLGKEAFTALLSGFFEITTGTSQASKLTSVGFPVQLAITSMIIGWAGLSVHSQVLSIISRTDISIKPYLLGKFLQGLFAAGYTWIGYHLLGTGPVNSQPAFLHLFSPVSVGTEISYAFSFLSSIAALGAFYMLAALTILLIKIFKNFLVQHH